MYVAVKGGEKAIANAHALLAKEGRGNPAVPRVEADAIASQLPVLTSRVMNEGSLYDRELAGRAIIQCQGDVVEAITLVRAYRTTLPRFGYSEPIDTSALPPQRRISATFKDVPGGQQLGATFDYTHRLLEPTQADADGFSAHASRDLVERLADFSAFELGLEERQRLNRVGGPEIRECNAGTGVAHPGQVFREQVREHS